MSLSENGGIPATMLVGPSGNGGFGNFGGDGWWIILLFILLCGNGGWGNGFGGGSNGNLYPWMNQAEITSNGFQNAQLGNQVTAVQSDLGDIQTQLCNGFAVSMRRSMEWRRMRKWRQMHGRWQICSRCSVFRRSSQIVAVRIVWALQILVRTLLVKLVRIVRRCQMAFGTSW